MIESITPAGPVQTILVTRLDAPGDIVLGTMLLWGLHEKWPSARILLIVRPQFANVHSILPDWVEVIPLGFDPRDSVAGREEAIAAELKAFSRQVAGADLVVVGEFNRNWASDLIAATSGARQIIAFDGPAALNVRHQRICQALGVGATDSWKHVAVSDETRESTKYQRLLAALGIEGAAVAPALSLRHEDRLAAAALWEQVGLDGQGAVVVFPSSGERGVRSFDASVWIRWIGRLLLTRQVVLLGAPADKDVLDAIERSSLPDGVKRVTAPDGNFGVAAAFLESAGAYIGMDTGPMHIAAVLGRPTLGVFGGGHRAERFLPVGRRAAAIRMPLGCYGCDWQCPFDRRLCIKDIPEWPLFEAGDAFLNDVPDNANPFSPRIYEISPPADLPAALLGPIMRKHRQFLELNHSLIEHHAYLARVNADQQAQIESLTAAQAALSRQNHERGNDVVGLAAAVAEMTRQNERRDAAIAEARTAIAAAHDTLALMTTHNCGRDEAIGAVNSTLAEMSRLNGQRDAAIDHINRTLAEMTRQNNARDHAIAACTPRQPPETSAGSL